VQDYLRGLAPKVRGVGVGGGSVSSGPVPRGEPSTYPNILPTRWR
jgi:hypothetical protein